MSSIIRRRRGLNSAIGVLLSGDGVAHNRHHSRQQTSTVTAYYLPRQRVRSILSTRRIQQSWPRDRDFRVLALDGGGIRGIFSATVLAEFEQRFLAGASIAGYFDLIAGTSTGGILALGLASGRTASELRDMYIRRGCEIFPPCGDGIYGRAIRRLRRAYRLLRYSYDSDALRQVLTDVLGDRKFGEANSRLCIPSFEGEYGEVFVFKTPHHPDYKKDLHELMVKVGLATAAAPTYFRPHREGGYTFVDGGVWANNPIMIAVTEALTAFDVARDKIRVLSVGCGDDPYRVDDARILKGGMWHWKDVINAAMRLQSQNALGQAGLLVGRDRLVRVDVPKTLPRIDLDDWELAVALMPSAARVQADVHASAVFDSFLKERASAYVPVIPPQ